MFGFEGISDASATINGTVVEVIVPYGTDVSKLIALFTTNGLEITVDGIVQTSGTTANDFPLPAKYTVTAEDGTTAEYTINVFICITREQLITMIAAGDNVTMADTSGITDMSELFMHNGTFNQDISRWYVDYTDDNRSAAISHDNFSTGWGGGTESLWKP